MTPARNNVRATRHFGIPARKSSPSAPLQPFPREKNSPGTPLQQFPREKVRPATASPWPNREKTLPARPKTPKSSHFSRAGRTFSRFQRRTTEQGEFSPATTPLNTHHRDTTTHPPPQPVQNSPNNTHLKAQPVQNSPSNTHLTARPVQNSPSMPTINENWPFLASKENYFPFPTPHHRAGRIFSRNYTTQYPSQGHHHPSTTPTGTKLSQQHPPQSPTGTKLSQQHPPHGSTGTKLSQHAHNQRKLAISRQQGELFPVPNTAPPSRENFLPQQHHSIPITGTPPPQPAQNPPSNAADNVLSPGHESARGTKLSRHAPPTVPARKNSPSNSPILAKPRKNSPSAPKNTKI